MAGKGEDRQSSKKDSQELWMDAVQEIVEVHNYAQIQNHCETLLSKGFGSAYSCLKEIKK